MKIYRIDLLSILFKFLVVSIILNAIFIFSVEDYNFGFSILSTLLVVGIEFLVFFLTKTLIEIEITHDSIQLYFRTLLVLKKRKVISLNNFQYSTKEEIGARGVKSEELRLYESYEKIVGIGRGFDGWSQKIISQLLNEFEDLRIKKID